MKWRAAIKKTNRKQSFRCEHTNYSEATLLYRRMGFCEQSRVNPNWLHRMLSLFSTFKVTSISSGQFYPIQNSQQKKRLSTSSGRKKKIDNSRD